MQFNIDLAYFILASTLRSSMPLILASIGSCFSMWAGVSDLGLEDVMLADSFSAVLGSRISGNVRIGFLTGIPLGAAFSVLHVIMHTSYKVNASISGTRVNLLASAVTPLLLNVIFGMSGESVDMTAFTKPNWGIPQKMLMTGRILGAQNILFFPTTLLVIVSWIFLYKTTLGLRVRMVSRNPQAASTIGLDVRIYRCFGVVMNGALAGLDGTYLSLGQTNLFVEDTTSGGGYIAVVVNTFGRHNPISTLGGSLSLGFLGSLQTIFQNILPSQLVMMTSYIFTLFIITLGLKGGKAPAGVDKHMET